MESVGPLSSGYDIAVAPHGPASFDLRNSVCEIMVGRGIKVYDNSNECCASINKAGYGGIFSTLFWSTDSFDIIVGPDISDHDTTRLLSSRFSMPVLLLGNAFDRLWWYFLYMGGHLIDRHCNCPEVYERESGDWYPMKLRRGAERDKAIDEFMRSWRGDADIVSEHLHVDSNVIEKYIRQYTYDELERLENAMDKYSVEKAYPSDTFSLASQWSYLHLVEHMGITEFSKTYWRLLKGEVDYSYPPIYTHPVVGPLEVDLTKPICAQKAFSGTFRGHVNECIICEQ